MKTEAGGEGRRPSYRGISGGGSVIGIPGVLDKGRAVCTYKSGESGYRDAVRSMRNKAFSDRVFSTCPNATILGVEITRILAVYRSNAKPDGLGHDMLSFC